MFQELARLFVTPTRIKLLKFFVLQPDNRVTGKSAATTVGVSARAVESELRALVRADIVSVRKQGKASVYALNTAHQLVQPLREFLDTTTLPPDQVLVETLRGIRGLTLIVATGVLADEPRGSVDLLIVTKKPNDARIAKAIKRLESIMALPLRFAVLELEDYRGRLESYDRLLRDVYEFNHRVIFGRRQRIAE